MEISRPTFSGHESFPFRSTWLTKGVQTCSEDPLIFTQPDAMVTLGVGKNMVRSIRHWCLATRMLEEDSDIKGNRGRQLRVTAIGQKLLGKEGWDPYLEDSASLWLIHWLLATNPDKAPTFFYALNLLREQDFTRASLEAALEAAIRKLPGLRLSEQTLRRDVDVFVRTYVGASLASSRVLEETLDCPLTELGLVFEVEPRRRYAFQRGGKESLPDAVVLYAVWDYARRSPQIRSLSFEDLAYREGSPGTVFKLDENALAERLERIDRLTADAWQYTETAGLKQVLMRAPIDGFAQLSSYYDDQRLSAKEAR